MPVESGQWLWPLGPFGDLTKGTSLDPPLVMVKTTNRSDGREVETIASEFGGQTFKAKARARPPSRLVVLDESTNWTHLRLYFNRNCVLKSLVYLDILWKPLSFMYLKFEGKHGHYRAKRSKRSKKNEEMKICESLNPFGESPIYRILAFCSSVLSPEGNEQISVEKEHLAYHRAALWGSVTPPNDAGHKDAKGNWWKTTKMTKRWMAEFIGDPE